MLSPTIETDRLILRRYKESDIDMMYEIISDERLSHYVSFPDLSKEAELAYLKDCISEADTSKNEKWASWGAWIEEGQWKYYDNFIDKVRNNTYIIMAGDRQIGFYNGEILANGNYEVGNICIIPKYQGRGIGTSILSNILEENKDRNIEIQYFKQNPVGKLYRKLGFVPYNETEFHYQMIKRR